MDKLAEYHTTLLIIARVKPAEITTFPDAKRLLEKIIQLAQITINEDYTPAGRREKGHA